MPIYEYRCESCGHELEAIQKMSDDPLVDCPECQQPALKKQISAVAFRLKGSGWYETDFKTGDKKKNLAKDSPASAGSKSEGKGKDSGSKDGSKKDSAKATTKTAAALSD